MDNRNMALEKRLEGVQRELDIAIERANDLEHQLGEAKDELYDAAAAHADARVAAALAEGQETTK